MGTSFTQNKADNVVLGDYNNSFDIQTKKQNTK